MMGINRYLLDERGEPKPVADLMEWAKGLEADMGGDARRAVVGMTIIGEGAEQVEVSTVFLFIDHNYRRGGPPILWETIVFGLGSELREQSRCAGGREQAEAMHERWCAEVCARLNLAPVEAGEGNHSTKTKEDQC